MKATVYTTEGKEKDKLDLPKEVFGLKWNPELVQQVLVSMESNKRTKIASTKDRSEVSGGGKKPWRQKGTGRARHGSNRSPIWVGGGVTFGPNAKVNFSKKVNKKMKTKALFTILSKKLEDNEVIFVENINFDTPKTAEAKKVIDSLSTIKGFETLKTKRNNKAVVAVDENDLNTKKSFSNFSNIHTDEVRNINPMQLLKYKYLIIENPKKSLETLVKKTKVNKE